MDSWEKFNETSLPDKEAFYSKLNKEGITDEYCEHAQKVWKVFKIKNLGEYHDLYVQSDTLLLADVYENSRDENSDLFLKQILNIEKIFASCIATYHFYLKE